MINASCVICLALPCFYTVPTTHLPTGACQAGWVSGASWKTLATQALVLAEAFARVQWWRAPPDSPVVVSVASKVKGCVWTGTLGRRECSQTQAHPLLVLPGPDCSQPDPCVSRPCVHGAPCSVGPDGRFACACPPGYQGQSCQSDIDECRSGTTCRHGGTCLNTPGPFRCQCPLGYTGLLCENPVVPCAPSPCRNGGTCRQSSDVTYDCACLPGK